MTEHRSITRSRSKKFKKEGHQHGGLDPAYAPPPLNIRKANAPVKPQSNQRVDVTAIGVAVGSPKNSPLPPLPRQHKEHMEHFQFPFPSPGRPRGSTDVSGGSRDSKTKGSRWKSLGSLFSKKDAAPRNVEKPRHNNPPPPVRPWGQHLTQEQTQSSRKRAGSDKEKALEQTIGQAPPQIARRPSLMRRASAKRKASQGRKPGQARVERNRSNRNSVLVPGSNNMSRVNVRQNALLRGNEDFSLLGIEIPNVELERYSVMFGSVLRDSPNASRTSLARPGKGKPEAIFHLDPIPAESVNQHTAQSDDILEPPKPRQREGSVSSTSSKTPSFSLFPPTATSSGRGSPARSAAAKPLPKPSPLSRAVTAPDTSHLAPRPPLKPNRSDEPPQFLVQDKENIPVSKWNRRHSRQGSRASSNSHDLGSDAVNRPESRGHIAQLSTDASHYPHARSHSRNPSLEPPTSHQQNPSQSKYLDVSEFSSNNPNMQGPAVRPQKVNDQPLRSNPTNTKQVFIDRAFPARKSSMRRLNTLTNPEALKTSLPNPAPELPEPPKPLPAAVGSEDQSTTNSESVSSAAEVSIARQISISRKQRQLLVPVMAKTARQPVQPLVVDGEGRKSELVFFDNDSPS